MHKPKPDAPKAVTPSNDSIETAATQPPARTHAQRAPDGRMGGKVEQDTEPSNTVSNNSNSEYFKPLRWGVDSLYLSYPGEIFPEADSLLKEKKKIAQSPEDHEAVWPNTR